MIARTRFIAVEITPARYAELTGLIEDRGFVVIGGIPCGLYPPDRAAAIADAIGGAQINYHITPAWTHGEGRRKLAHVWERLVCPTAPNQADGSLHTIIGCGSTNVAGPDDEGYYDCLDCGIWFNPADKLTRGAA